MEFANKEYLLLLFLLLPYIIWYFLYKRKSEPTLKMSDTYAFANAPKSWRMRLIHLPMLLRCAVFALVVIILARPQTINPMGNEEVEGINIMLAVDVSASMLSNDVQPNRIEVAKDVASEFIAARPTDNIGLTIFAGEAFTQCPMTTDQATLLNLLRHIRADLSVNGIIQDGTAIGMGLANAVSRLKDAKGKSKVVILLTDGSNNVGDISPLTAAEIAKKFGIRVYTIGLGVGAENAQGQVVADIDYKTLQNISAMTDAAFYRAESRSELSQIYKDIDKLEKSKLSASSYAKRYEAYLPFAVLALLIFRTIVLRRIP